MWSTLYVARPYTVPAIRNYEQHNVAKVASIFWIERNTTRKTSYLYCIAAIRALL